jgi:hypothetical protein
VSARTSPLGLIAEFADLCRKEGIPFACRKALSYMKARVGMIDPVLKRRMALSKQVDAMLKSTVAYGPFKGLRLPAEVWWGTADRACMLFGLYEQEVQNSLGRIPATHRTFVDLGAADGYYGVGVLVNHLFDNSHCFEVSETGRDVIRRCAEQNGVSDTIAIHGIAEKDFDKYLPTDQLSTSVLLVDIEGGEFDLFDRPMFDKFKGSILILELHDHFFEDGDDKLRRLRKDAAPFFDITELTTTSRDLSQFPELRKFSDSDRWLICSEGRRVLPHWYRLDPAQGRQAMAAGS